MVGLKNFWTSNGGFVGFGFGFPVEAMKNQLNCAKPRSATPRYQTNPDDFGINFWSGKNLENRNGARSEKERQKRNEERERERETRGIEIGILRNPEDQKK